MLRKVVLTFLTVALVGLVAGCGGGASAQEETSSSEDGQLTRVDVTNPVHGTSYVAPLVEIFGEVFIGENSFVAGNTILRASPNNRLEIGSEINAQDNIIVRALENNSTIGNETSLAHHAIVRDSDIGDFAFVGFNAEVVDSTVSDGAFILHGASVEGVEIPENALVDVGEEITTQEEADALPEAPEATEEFRREVLDVNAEFAEGYIELYETEGYEAVIGIGPNPETSFNSQTEPQIGEGAEIQEFVRIVGDVRLGENAQVGQRTAIRADEGSPIVIGDDADIDDRVTFHALKDTDIQVGDNVTAVDDVVVHGPVEIGDGVSTEDRSVIFRARVGDNVSVGEGAIIAGPAPEEEGGELPLEIPDGTVIPDGAIVTDEESLQQAIAGNPVKKIEFASTDRKTNLFARASHGEVAGGRTRLGHSH